MVRAIIFDCFGVLATDGWLSFVEQFFPIDSPQHQQALDLNKAVDSGLLEYDDFIEAITQMTGVRQADARQQIGHNVPNIKLCSYIKENLRPTYKIGMLSNAGANWLPEIFNAQQIELFDCICLSYAIGFVKPLPRAYEYIAQKLEVACEECIFIDDQLRFCEGARAVGMQAIQYQDLVQVKEQLTRLLTDAENKPPVSSY
jgi:putative hydrolase of the HAD superfamily